MKVPCADCMRDHDVLAAQMVRIIGAFQRGELHVVTHGGEIIPQCILKATVPGTGRKARSGKGAQSVS